MLTMIAAFARETAWPWAKRQFGQVTTAFGLAGGFGTLTAVLTKQIHWTAAMPPAVTSAWLIGHPEKMQPLTQDHINQLGQALQAAAETISKPT